jgi:hypothetical protein
VADHQDPSGLRGRDRDLLGVGHRLGHRLLHEAVLAGGQDALGELRVARHGRCDRHRVELRVGEELVELGGGARVRKVRRPP